MKVSRDTIIGLVITITSISTKSKAIVSLSLNLRLSSLFIRRYFYFNI